MPGATRLAAASRCRIRGSVAGSARPYTNGTISTSYMAEVLKPLFPPSQIVPADRLTLYRLSVAPALLTRLSPVSVKLLVSQLGLLAIESSNATYTVLATLIVKLINWLPVVVLSAEAVRMNVAPRYLPGTVVNVVDASPYVLIAVAKA